MLNIDIRERANIVVVTPLECIKVNLAHLLSVNTDMSEHDLSLVQE